MWQKKLKQILTLIFTIICFYIFIKVEQQNKQTHILNNIGRLPDRNISNQSYQISVNLANGSSSLNYPSLQRNLFLFNQYPLLYELPEHSLCVVIINSTKHTIAGIKSVLQQQYTNYKVVVVVNNRREEQMIIQYIQTNSLDIRKVKVLLHNLKLSDILKECGSDDIMVGLNAGDKLIGYQVFKVINSIFVSDKKVKAMYTACLNSEFKLGLSYPVIANYPILIGGVVAVNISCIQLTPSQTLSTKQLKTKMIECTSNEQNALKYIPHPLLLQQNTQSQPISSNDKK